jgi:hypothetical protein
MPFYEKGDVRIHYEEAGSGFPLLVIPGVPAIIEAWLRSSENTVMLGNSRAKVDNAASLAT